MIMIHKIMNREVDNGTTFVTGDDDEVLKFTEKVRIMISRDMRIKMQSQIQFCL